MLPYEQMDEDQRLDFMKGALIALDVRPPRRLRVPLFESNGALAYLRRGFPAEMRSKQYLGALSHILGNIPGNTSRQSDV
jgi:hypothetical protein